MTEIIAEMSAHVPHPGSRLDQTATAAAAETPAALAGDGCAEAAFVVQTRADMPEETIPRTMVLSANNPYLPILPRDMRRRRAVIIPVSNDIVLCETKELAQQVAALAVTTPTGAQEITPTNPAATTPLIYTLPYAATIISATFSYTASATVATRFVLFEITDAAGNVVAQVQTNSGTVAGTTVTPWLSSSPQVAQAAQFSSYVPLPAAGTQLPAGYQLEVNAAGGMTSGDTITGARFVLQPATAVTAGSLPMGGYIPKGTQAVIESRGWMYAAVVTTGSVSPVTVIAERYAHAASH